MCYKPIMRNWMRERMKRRKKSQDKTPTGETAQAPLQPAYFDAHAPAGDSSAKDEQSRAPQSAAEEIHDSEPAESAEQPEVSQHAEERSGGESQPAAAATDGGPARRRRRRGRGGRGRTGSRGEPGRGQPQTGSEASEAEPKAIAPKSTSEDEAAGAAKRVPRVGTQATPVPVAGPRAPKGTVVLAIGLPGSGKSSWFKRHNITPLSSDMLRSILFDDPQEQRFQDLVFSNLRSMLKARLIARRPMNYVDATNLTPHDRHSWIKLAKDYGYEVQAVFFDVPLEVCMQRNQKRERVVDEDAMRRMAGKLKAPTFEEGFSKVTVVRVKKKE
jgi:predicted kinase